MPGVDNKPKPELNPLFKWEGKLVKWDGDGCQEPFTGVLESINKQEVALHNAHGRIYLRVSPVRDVKRFSLIGDSSLSPSEYSEMRDLSSALQSRIDALYVLVADCASSLIRLQELLDQ